MPFKRFVETGRVAYISGGRYSGKLCSIVDVIDQTRVLVDGPLTGVPRIPVRLNQIRLTKYVFKFPFKGSTKVVRETWEKKNILGLWKEGKWAGNLSQRRLRRHMSDFDRFKLRHARKARNSLRTKEYCRLLKSAKRRKERVKKGQAKWRKLQVLKKTNPEKAALIEKARAISREAARKPRDPKPKKLKVVSKKKKKIVTGKTKVSVKSATKVKGKVEKGVEEKQKSVKSPKAQKPETKKSGSTSSEKPQK